MKLSDLKCRKAASPERLTKLADGEGLYLHVYPNGRKLWRLSYRYAGKQRDLPIGPYPEVSLLEARDKRQEARKLLRDGRDPAATKKAEEETAAALQETTFAAFADLYLDRLAKTGRSAPTIKKARWIVEDLARDLRDQQVADIKPRDVLRVLRVIEAKGNRETARRMRGVLSAVFRLAVIEQAIDVDPSAPLKGALLPPQTKHQAAVIDPAKFGALLRAIDGYDGHKTIKLALQILALTFPRPGELRCAEWSEVDTKGMLWIIPAPRTKMRREHRIPLSRQAAERFEELRAITGKGTLCFPSIRSLGNPLAEAKLEPIMEDVRAEGWAFDEADVAKHITRCESAAPAALAKLREAWGERLPSGTDALWAFASEADQQTLLDLLAVLVAPAIELRATRALGVSEAICEAAGLDMSTWWTATPESYFEHVRKDVIIDAIKELSPKLDRSKLDKASKKEVLARAKKMFKGRAWLPEALRVGAPAPSAQAAAIAAE